MENANDRLGWSDFVDAFLRCLGCYWERDVPNLEPFPPRYRFQYIYPPQQNPSMREPLHPDMAQVGMCAVEFAYYLNIHNTLKTHGLQTGKLLATVRADLEISIALRNGHRRIPQ